ncbi:ABC transporter ATP-binding protein [Isachenkonia alkalipeptolytica]|uniref:ABC-type quaternary amine transporter n=1 Tax=Isachenkonia alkalipeptolytica TaxID=2565777 RepID=A0AA43XJ69_9CLOT|nr:ABC transporter ATP-binding protein [Isachenkonia alkalipeptolytica]NBG87835.1 ABC transporter ATP-binding protein [Isachenkonia alkalipeptolytica]
MKEVYLQDISKKYGKEETIKNLTLKVNKGEMISLLGPSGCGKTTTLKIIAGLVAADQGKVFIDGLAVDHLPTQKRGAVIVFQDHRLFPHMTVGGNIEFGLRMQRVPKEIRRKKVQEMLKFVGLQDHGGKFPGEISGGQKQRVAIARGLIVSPKVLLLDEPFSNLDQRLKEEMRNFIVDIQRKLKITTILVSHDKEDSLVTSSKIGVMFDGELKQYGTPEELYETPKTLEIARFFGEVNEIPIEKIDDVWVYTVLGIFPKIRALQTIEKSSKLLLRPEALVLSKEDKEAYGDRGVDGKIMNRIYAGEKTYYEFDVKGFRGKASVMGKGLWQIGDSVRVSTSEESMIVCE